MQDAKYLISQLCRPFVIVIILFAYQASHIDYKTS